jgi:hypothetical protein
MATASSIFVIRGHLPEDRLLSYACLWAFAPNARITFYEIDEASPNRIHLGAPDEMLLISATDNAEQEVFATQEGVIFNQGSLALYGGAISR